MSIYTRTGDTGKTSLFSGERVDKDALRVEAYGTLDELNSVLGLARRQCRDPKVIEILERTQHDLFTAGADLATRPGGRFEPERVAEEDWRRQESWIDELTAPLPRLKQFILPGGTAGAATIHLARSVCRRAERLIVRLGREEGDLNRHLLIYVNRLSDLLFTMARAENAAAGQPDVVWEGGRSRT